MTVIEPDLIAHHVDGSAARIELRVPAELEYFDGHFPGAPVVPGVVQIKWAIEAARRHLGCAGAVTGMEAVKFQQVMGPCAQVTLALRYAAESGKLLFSFESRERRFSSGRILFTPSPAPNGAAEACR
jgi:3-hydroxymyristoyl/3-hydroxydecanoyl-(acyl carrier protein) dehydratase